MIKARASNSMVTEAFVFHAAFAEILYSEFLKSCSWGNVKNAAKGKSVHDLIIIPFTKLLRNIHAEQTKQFN